MPCVLAPARSSYRRCSSNYASTRHPTFAITNLLINDVGAAGRDNVCITLTLWLFVQSLLLRLTTLLATRAISIFFAFFVFGVCMLFGCRPGVGLVCDHLPSSHQPKSSGRNGFVDDMRRLASSLPGLWCTHVSDVACSGVGPVCDQLSDNYTIPVPVCVSALRLRVAIAGS